MAQQLKGFPARVSDARQPAQPTQQSVQRAQDNLTQPVNALLDLANAAFSGPSNDPSLTVNQAVLPGTPGNNSTNAGVRTRGVSFTQGMANTTQGNPINFWWTGSALQAWVNATNIGNITLTSDRRIKDNITTFTGVALPMVNQVRVVTYTWKQIGVFQPDGSTHIGVIADEVQQILPTAVNGAPDAMTADGQVQPQTINIMEVLPLLVKAIQELSAQVESLQSQVAALTPPSAPNAT